MTERALNPRPLLAMVFALLSLAPLPAQPPVDFSPGVIGGPEVFGGPIVVGDPMVIDGGLYSDPYAIMDESSPWYSSIPTLSTPTVLRDRLWLKTEYLRWGTEGMNVPPLVTTSPPATAQNQAAVLGEPDTGVLFGGNEINGSAVSGIRTRASFWLRRDAAFAIEAEYIGLSSQNDGYTGVSDGTAILGRPYFDIVAGSEAAQLVSYPGVVSGYVQVASHTRLRSFLLNGRTALLPPCGPACDDLAAPSRLDFIAGYRYLSLDDQLYFAETRNAISPALADTISSSEQFVSSNQFNGLQFGIIHQTHYRRAWLESMIRVAVGNTRQKVSIQGGTSITDNGVTENYNGGLLAQRTNIGTFRRDQFTMIPELGMTLGFRLSSCFHATIGYSVLYFPSVVRAGEQIDRDVNPNLIPPEANPFSGALRPRFRMLGSDYWAQGLSLGGELRF